jgi:membrane associated rhomboid family serine protease
MAKEEPRELGAQIVREAKDQATILGGFVGLLWIIQAVNWVLGGALVNLGVHPRTWSGLLGIFFAPFIHGGWGHLIANTIPLAVLGWFVMLRRKRDLFTVSVLSALVGGLGIWLIAPAASVHIGASILIFGYLGYLLFRGIFERRFWPIVGSIVTFFLYGGALFGVLPGQAGISWQGHLFGLLGGILAARLLKNVDAEALASRSKPTRTRVESLPSGKARVATETPPKDDEPDEEIEEELARLRRMR